MFKKISGWRFLVAVENQWKTLDSKNMENPVRKPSKTLENQKSCFFSQRSAPLIGAFEA